MTQSSGIGIGTAANVIVGSLFILSLALEGRFPACRYLAPVLLCGFIGGFTNTIAIRMLFEKYWFLPGSGVILKRRKQIINSLAQSVETYIINHEMIEKRLRDAITGVDVERVQQALNAAVDEFRQEALRYVNSEAIHDRIRNALKEQLGLLGTVIHWTGIKDLEVAADDLQAYLGAQVSQFTVTPAMVNGVLAKTGTLEEFMFRPGNPLLQKHYRTDESLVQMLLSRFDVKTAVVEKLSQYPPERIRDLVEENIRKHLAWLEVFGVILGMAFSVAYVML
jgi:uncharacterized membrane protein YheB (UPF0754 family)